jgi:hypothetical protein
MKVVNVGAEAAIRIDGSAEPEPKEILAAAHHFLILN